MTIVPLVTAALAAAPSDAPERVSQVYDQHYQAAPDRVLPLLTPIGERSWASDWEPEIRWEPPGGGAGTLFVTRHPGRSAPRTRGTPDTVWVLDVWEPAAGHVRYVRVTPGSDVTEIDIRLRPDGKDRTIATVRYTWTSLGEPGVALLRTKTPEAYRHFMREWEQELNHFLITGKKLERGH